MCCSLNFLHFSFDHPTFLSYNVCKKLYCNLDVYACFQSPDIYKVYMEELRTGRIPFKDSPELLMLLLEFSSRSPSLFGEFKVSECVLVFWFMFSLG